MTLRPASAALLVALAGVLSACDEGASGLPDPVVCPELRSEDLDFVALHVGARWIYAYKESGFWLNSNSPGGSSFHNEGELELEVMELTCRDGTASYTVLETHRPKGESSTTQERVFTETEWHDVSLPPFFVPEDPLRRYHVTTADTVAATGNSPCETHSAAIANVRLRRGIGIDVVRSFAHARTFSCERLMTLLMGPGPDPG